MGDDRGCRRRSARGAGALLAGHPNLGLTVLWAAVAAVAIQWFINMEVERWTLPTGETAITGFTRLWRPWWALFVVMALVPNVFPGFASGAATCLGFVVGGLDVKLVAILGLIAVGRTLTASAVVYQNIAFAGSGGAGNLAVSNWMRDKGMGMGAYIPRIVSPRGEQEAVPSLGTRSPPTSGTWSAGGRGGRWPTSSRP